jgi:transcriptional regulator with XRE-family HTH domain
MPAASISPTTPAPPAGRHRGPDQMVATSTPSGTAGKSRFRLARERRGLTQQQVADRCELSLKTIKRYDAGGRPRSVEIAQRLAEVLEQPLEWLWPPEANLNVRVARANYPAPPPPGPASIPDPHDVLATLRQTRPRGRQRHARRLAPAITLATVAAIITIVVLASTGHQGPTGTQTGADPRDDIAPALSSAPPPLLAAGTVETANDHRASKRRPKQRSHPATSHHQSQKRVLRSGAGSSPAVAARSEQPTSTAQQPVAPTASSNAITRVASPQPATSNNSEFGFER